MVGTFLGCVMIKARRRTQTYACGCVRINEIEPTRYIDVFDMCDNHQTAPNTILELTPKEVIHDSGWHDPSNPSIVLRDSKLSHCTGFLTANYGPHTTLSDDENKWQERPAPGEKWSRYTIEFILKKSGTTIDFIVFAPTPSRAYSEGKKELTDFLTETGSPNTIEDYFWYKTIEHKE